MMLYDIIVRSSRQALRLKGKKKFMPPGHDGPHYDEETPVRNSSHWLITFLKAYDITKDEKFREASIDLAEYLISKDARPMDANFFHRKNPEKDFCNNLIGAAWTIEALVEASKKLKKNKYKKIAKEVFLMHDFNKEIGLWYRRNVDGSKGSIDHTFNHQLWFAAAGSMIGKNKNINKFLDMTPKLMRVNPDGLIDIGIRKHSKNTFKRIFYSLDFLFNTSKIRKKINYYKAVGYQGFHLYGFALLYKNFPDHRFWETKIFQKSLLYILTDEYKKSLDKPIDFDTKKRIPKGTKILIHNRYGYAYNPPGFENAYAILIFKKLLPDDIDYKKLASYWISKQINHCYNFKENMMNKNTHDPLTLAARLYEVVRLPNLELKL